MNLVAQTRCLRSLPTGFHHPTLISSDLTPYTFIESVARLDHPVQISFGMQGFFASR